MFKKITQKSIYKDAWVELFQDEIGFPDGSSGTYAWVNRKNGVGVVVTTSDQKILVHKEYRYVIKADSWEVQGGGIDDGETPEQAAVRELKEEAGIQINTDQLQKLGVFYPLHSFNTESVTLFMVVINPTQTNTDGTETSEDISEQRYVTFDEALKMIDDGKINDAFTAHAIQMTVRKININK
ncbi:MAG TPA: NUDIX hydrolase [Vitreimonas sp.]|nr:NUDIX hydrolase [Vitreimonas sp.]